MTQRTGSGRWCTGAFIAILLGCGGGVADQPDLGTVTGVVTLDGEPLQSATIEFQPAKGRPSTATTNADGEYELVYTSDDKGAKIGKHTVWIWTFATADDPETGEPKVTSEEKVPVVYNSQSTLTRTVVAGSQEIDFDLESNKGEIVQKSPYDQ